MLDVGLEILVPDPTIRGDARPVPPRAAHPGRVVAQMLPPGRDLRPAGPGSVPTANPLPVRRPARTVLRWAGAVLVVAVAAPVAFTTGAAVCLLVICYWP